MSPLNPEFVKSLIDAAQKSFPDKQRSELTREFNVMSELQHREFYGSITPEQKADLTKLEEQFYPKPKA